MGLHGGNNNDSNSFSPASWYAEKPCEEDKLYQVVKVVHPAVVENVAYFEERYSQEKKENAGQGT